MGEIEECKKVLNTYIECTLLYVVALLWNTCVITNVGLRYMISQSSSLNMQDIIHFTVEHFGNV